MLVAVCAMSQAQTISCVQNENDIHPGSVRFTICSLYNFCRKTLLSSFWRCLLGRGMTIQSVLTKQPHVQDKKPTTADERQNHSCGALANKHLAPFRRLPLPESPEHLCCHTTMTPLKALKLAAAVVHHW